MASTLSQDDKEAAAQVANWPEAVKAILKALDDMVTAREQCVIKCDINSGNFTELAMTKARAEGARMLATDFRRYLESLKQSP